MSADEPYGGDLRMLRTSGESLNLLVELTIGAVLPNDSSQTLLDFSTCRLK